MKEEWLFPGAMVSSVHFSEKELQKFADLIRADERTWVGLKPEDYDAPSRTVHRQ